jgi:hypothetical protein
VSIVLTGAEGVVATVVSVPVFFSPSPPQELMKKRVAANKKVQLH